MKKEHYYYMIGITILFKTIIPILELLLFKGKYRINNNIISPLIKPSIIVYPCVGYYLHNKYKINNSKKTIKKLWLINIITIISTCFMVYYNWRLTGVYSEEKAIGLYLFFTPVNLICIFITSKYFFENLRISSFLEKITCSIGLNTLGIYLFHVIIINMSFMKNSVKYMQKIGINYMLVCFIYVLCTMTIGYIITYLLKKIPILKKIL